MFPRTPLWLSHESDFVRIETHEANALYVYAQTVGAMEPDEPPIDDNYTNVDRT